MKLRLTVGAALFALGAASAFAQEAFPTRAITMIGSANV